MRLATVAALLRADARLVRRDAYLLGVIAIPILTALLLRFGAPPLGAWLETRWAFDTAPYHPLLVGYLVVLMTPLAIGTVGGFVLLEERDDRTLDALRVTPMPFGGFLTYRALVVAVASFLLLPVCVPIAAIAPLAWGPLLAVSLAAAPIAPVVMLFFGAFAVNKVHGVGLQKLLSALLMLPVAAYFLPAPWAGAVALAFPPTFAARAFWSFAQDRPGAGLAAAAAVATLAPLALVLLRRFARRSS